MLKGVCHNRNKFELRPEKGTELTKVKNFEGMFQMEKEVCVKALKQEEYNLLKELKEVWLNQGGG